MENTAVNSYGSLFNDCATGCEAYAACGGFRSTAPCGCAWPAGSDRRKKCGTCYLLCRDRPDFVARLSEGKLIEQVSIKHEQPIQFPLFIPINTHDFQGANLILPVRWVAADLRIIFNLKKTRPATIKPHFDTTDAARKYLHVDSNCQLLTVLNGKDKFLESFWGMDRPRAFKHLMEIGFSVGTGPTFSVSELTTIGTPTPYAHHTAMLMRHHRVVGELQNAGLAAIPNLYWIDGDKQEVNRWGEWLLANPLLRFVSRDFTMTGNKETITSKLKELLQILDISGRSFHVLIVGTGPVNAPLVLKKLHESGHSASVITSSPIMHAQSNIKYRLDRNNKIIKEPAPNLVMRFHELILHNMRVLEDALLLSVNGPNVIPSTTACR